MVRLQAGWTVAAVAAAQGLDPKTVRKWRDRDAAKGEAGLADRSSRPHQNGKDTMQVAGDWATLRLDPDLHRSFANRREVAAYAGLTSSPYASGDRSREQGISKAGNPLLRKTAIKLAWLWLRYQLGSALARWFAERAGAVRGRGVARDRSSTGLIAVGNDGSRHPEPVHLNEAFWSGTARSAGYEWTSEPPARTTARLTPHARCNGCREKALAESPHTSRA